MCFVDDEVVLDSDWAYNVASAFESGGIVAIAGNTVTLSQNYGDSWLPKSLYWIVSCAKWYGNGTHETGNMWTMNSAIDKQVFTTVGGIDATLGPRGGKEAGYLGLAEDLAFSLRLRAAGYKIHFIPLVSCGHHVQHAQVSFAYIIKKSIWIGFERRLLMLGGIVSRKRARSILALMMDLVLPRNANRASPSGVLPARLAICVSILSALYGFLLVHRASLRIASDLA